VNDRSFKWPTCSIHVFMTVAQLPKLTAVEGVRIAQVTLRKPACYSDA
jgi:hypothetical protein